MKKAFFLIHLILAIPFLFSQERGTANFPTEISARTAGSEVILSWKDTESLSGEVYHIHRHRVPITRNNLNEASLIDTVQEGVELYRDSPPADVDWYYLITIEDSRSYFPIVIPYANATVRGIKIDKKALSLTEAVTVSHLSARPAEGEIHITFTRNNNLRAVSLYRSTSPITSMDQLKDSLLISVLEGDQHSWSDNPIPGIPYYYAAVDRELLSFGADEALLYTGNHTVDSVGLPLSQFLENPRSALPVRKAPLPTLQLEKYYTGLPPLDVVFPPEQSLSPTLDRKLKAFLSRPDEELPTAVQPQILADEENTEGTTLLESKLKKILGEYFLKNRWDHAERAMLILLDEVEDNTLKERIHFYRGQCFYFQEKYESAYLEFLLSRDGYYQVSNEWMERSLDQLL